LFWQKRNAAVPVRGTAGSAGLDLRSNMTCTIRKGKQLLIGTGVKVQIPEGYVGLIYWT